jgi:hypothetical protein
MMGRGILERGIWGLEGWAVFDWVGVRRVISFVRQVLELLGSV